MNELYICTPLGEAFSPLMAANHVQLDDSSQEGRSTNIYHQGHDLHDYGQFFQNNGEQAFDAGWDLNATHLPIQGRSHSQPVPHTWQSPNANHASVPYDESNQFYSAASYANNQVPYQEAFSRQSSAHFDQQALDPALVSSNNTTTNFELPVNQASSSANQSTGTVVPQALQNDRQLLPNGFGGQKTAQASYPFIII